MNFHVRPERTAWRDQSISERHRLFYGWNCAAVDLDLVLVEYESGKPSALIEYKAVGAKPVNLEHPTYRALRSLADCSSIPFLIAFYNSAIWVFTVTPANEFARAYVSETTYSEREYVTLLYKMRGLEAEAETLAALNDIKPEHQVNKKPRIPPSPTQVTATPKRRIPPSPNVHSNRRLYAETINTESQ